MEIRIHLSIKKSGSTRYNWKLRCFTDDIRDADMFLSWSGSKCVGFDEILLKISMFVDQIQLKVLRGHYDLNNIRFSFTTDCNEILEMINSKTSVSIIKQLQSKIARFNFSSKDCMCLSEFNLDNYDVIIWYDAARDSNGGTRLGVCIEANGNIIKSSECTCTSKSIMSAELFALSKAVNAYRRIIRHKDLGKKIIFVGDNMQLVSLLCNEDSINPNTKLARVREEINAIHGDIKWFPSELNKADSLTR